MLVEGISGDFDYFYLNNSFDHKTLYTICKNTEILSPDTSGNENSLLPEKQHCFENSRDSENVCSIATFSLVRHQNCSNVEKVAHDRLFLQSSDVQKTTEGLLLQWRWWDESCYGNVLLINCVVVFSLFVGFIDQILCVRFRNSIFLGFAVLQLTLRANKDRSTSILRLQ